MPSSAIWLADLVFGRSIKLGEVGRHSVPVSPVRFAHGEHVADVTSRRPPNHHHAAVQQADGDDPRFTVICTPILELEHRPSEHQACIGEIQATLGQGPRPLTGSYVIFTDMM